jgi:AAA+ ATPase superfamily predicted ATPase
MFRPFKTYAIIVYAIIINCINILCYPEFRRADMFRGRKNELKVVRDALDGNGNILVYGPRRVGKTTLLKEVVGDFPGTCVWYECVKGSLEYNIELFAGAVATALGKSYLANIRDLFDLFQMIAEGGKRIVVVIDEYPYLKESREGGVVDSYFQRIIDGKYPGLSLVLCGSFISMMRELLQRDNPLFGRFDLVMQVKPFDYLDASLFYGEVPVREKIAMYSVFGGSPFVLERIDPSRSVEENIENLLLQDTALSGRPSRTSVLGDREDGTRPGDRRENRELEDEVQRA